MIIRIGILLCCMLMITNCSINPLVYEMEKLPDSKVAIIHDNTFHDHNTYKAKFNNWYFDGKPLAYTDRVLPGPHSIGILVNWGTVCLPLANGCFHECYGGFVFMAEAGQSYDFDIENNEEDIHLIMLDSTGKTIARSLCEKMAPLRLFLQNQPEVKSVNDRLGKKLEELRGQGTNN